jgi:hypothetical protein
LGLVSASFVVAPAEGIMILVADVVAEKRRRVRNVEETGSY